jgi:hypothetical protein
VFLTRRIGVGAEVSWRSQGRYAGVKYRPSFYNFDAIYRPARPAARLVPEFRLGIGGVHVNYFPDDPSFCDQLTGCPGSSHFQVHMSVAAPWYLTNHFFLRPAIDAHYVNHFSEFSSNWVPQFSMGIGYSLGRE